MKTKKELKMIAIYLDGILYEKIRQKCLADEFHSLSEMGKLLFQKYLDETTDADKSGLTAQEILNG